MERREIRCYWCNGIPNILRFGSCIGTTKVNGRQQQGERTRSNNIKDAKRRLLEFLLDERKVARYQAKRRLDFNSPTHQIPRMMIERNPEPVCSLNTSRQQHPTQFFLSSLEILTNFDRRDFKRKSWHFLLCRERRCFPGFLPSALIISRLNVKICIKFLLESLSNSVYCFW